MTVDKPSNPPVQLPDVNAAAYSSDDAVARDVIEGIKLAGACIVRNVYSKDVIEQLRQEVRPYITESGKLTYFQENVATVPGLAGKSPTYATEVLGNPLWKQVREYFLTYEHGPYWIGDMQKTHKTTVQLGSATCLELRPGAEAQGLHRDDLVHQGWNSEAAEYSLGRDRSLTFFAACNRTHRANGATRILPGSHLWDYSRPPPSDGSGVVDAELDVGDILIILGSVYHGGGANTTTDERRMVVTCGVTCSYLRQEENQYLANDVERIRRLPLDIQRFIGYSPYPPGAGLVNWADPLRIINPDAGDFQDIQGKPATSPSIQWEFCKIRYVFVQRQDLFHYLTSQQVVIVTGSASGIGLATVQAALNEGAHVMGVDMVPMPDSMQLHETPDFSFLQMDLTDPCAPAAVVTKCIAAFGGRIDGLVNVAGVADRNSSVDTLTDEDWDRCLTVNLTAPVRLMREVIPIMRQQRSGTIVNVASKAGLSGVAAGAAYTASKHGLLGITKNVAWRFKGDNIRCNAVCPGPVETQMLKPREPSRLDHKAIETVLPVLHGIHIMDSPGIIVNAGLVTMAKVVLALLFPLLAVNVWRDWGSVNGRKLFDLGKGNVSKRYTHNAGDLIRAGFAQGRDAFYLDTGEDVELIAGPKYVKAIGNDKRFSFPKYNEARSYAELDRFDIARSEFTGDKHLILALKGKLTQSLGDIVLPLSEETSAALKTHWTDRPGEIASGWRLFNTNAQSDWHKIPLRNTITSLVFQLSYRVFLGKELCRDPRWLNLSQTYAVDVIAAINALRPWPKPLRPMVARFLRPYRHLLRARQTAQEILSPVIEKRREENKAKARKGDKTDDLIGWLDECAGGCYGSQVTAFLFLSLVATHTVADLITQTLFNLCEHPDLIPALREEAASAHAAHGWSKDTIKNLDLMDSVLKETLRLKPIGICPMLRLAQEEVTMDDGFTIPKGTKIQLSCHKMWDAEVYPEPERFDGYRFLKLRQAPGWDVLAQLVSTSPEHLGFGYGVHACPGRFFAATEVKLVLCHILLKYDFALADGIRPSVLKLGTTLTADPMAQINIRRRQNGCTV
ncbi:hypothetical protein CNMCM6106_006166 [Aspergillus hiratsukae]|uniref:Uncharacterized protein n=1 Tax=Aspergillus hiratsukae TaxID=1194566 RepID=A0A8H6QH42_9EURO|nr:hypothetical protein CNMCM6106_006166 [Aspergillus hiratsukae]